MKVNIFCTSCGKKLRENNSDIKDTDENINIETKYNFTKNCEDEVIEKTKCFYECLYKANCQKSEEILEVLIEFDDLDNAFLEIKKIKPTFMNRQEYDEAKNNIIDNIINEKFRKCFRNEKKKKEKLKSLLDELYVCKRRYPEYYEILNKYITSVITIIDNK